MNTLADPPSSPQTALFPVVTSPGPQLIYLTLSAKSQVTISIRKDIPCRLHMDCPQLALHSDVHSKPKSKALTQAWLRYQ